MKNPRVSGCLRGLALALLIVLLGACGGRDEIKNGTTAAANAPTSFDLTVAADKNGQFNLDGATLTREDLSSHIRYLADVGKPVHTLLLKPGEKDHVKGPHIAAIAGICRDMHITGYVSDGEGHLKVIKIVE